MRIKRAIVHAVVSQWYQRLTWLACLLPLSCIYGCYMRSRLRKSIASAFVPVWVVGNVTIGGNGKTPLVNWLIGEAIKKGLNPAVVMRGYGGTYQCLHCVQGNDSASLVGDEALCYVRQWPTLTVVVARNRRDALDWLAQHRSHLDLIIADDGLQNRGLPKDQVWVCIDVMRQMGNGYCLPAGPLRQPLDTIPEEYYRVYRGLNTNESMGFEIKPLHVRRLADGRLFPLSWLNNRSIHALAGIGNPESFFSSLRILGAEITKHPKLDHEAVDVTSLSDDLPWVMTAKDAVKIEKCDRLDVWVLDITIEPNQKLSQSFQRAFERSFSKFLENEPPDRQCIIRD